jgi:hypothetical protein
MQQACSFHPDYASVEQCEVCARDLCDVCLWYDDSGRRLCVTHARAHEAGGGEVYSPEHYDEALSPQIIDPYAAIVPIDKAPYRGNSQDMTAGIAALIGITSLASCFGGMYCLPVFGGILGVVSLLKASESLKPDRTRNLSLVAIFIGILGLAPIVLALGYFGMMMLIFGAAAASGGSP